MAKKARKSPRTVSLSASPRKPTISQLWLAVIQAVISLGLAAISSSISQRSLSPVYGSTPSHTYHQALSITGFLTGFALQHYFPKSSGQKSTRLLPALAFSIPTIQFYLERQSSSLGNPLGPPVTELLTVFPLVLLSTITYSAPFITLQLKKYGTTVSESVTFISGLALFTSVEKAAEAILPRFVGSNSLLNSSGLQLVLGALYVAAFPSPWVLLGLPSFFFSLAWNVHMPFHWTTTMLNSKLHEIGYTLVDRQESITGYISVLDNTHGFRAMRCDHSLLGGEWTNRPADYRPKVADPIFAVFTMLEAVRLAETEDNQAERPDNDKTALVIGLGIGTTPAALIQHGIDTTVVEIDPVVYKFASQYFDFPSNHTAIIDDAVTFVEKATQKEEVRHYDYIVHDVFTGGVEPVDLFTLEFMLGLNALLEDDGVVAINYAGDLSLPGTGLVVRTVQTAFPRCRIFREDDPETAALTFTNMVIFCKKGRTPLRFRAPTSADFLGSKSRESYMFPQFEIDPMIFEDTDVKSSQRILQVGMTDLLEAYHTRSAIGHWKIMRTVLPVEIWENW